MSSRAARGSVEYGKEKRQEDGRQLEGRDDKIFHDTPGSTPIKTSVIRTARKVSMWAIISKSSVLVFKQRRSHDCSAMKIDFNAVHGRYFTDFRLEGY